MTPTERLCRKRNHDLATPHTDQAECDAMEAEDRKWAVEELTSELVELREGIRSMRKAITDAEKEQARVVREALGYGGSATALAKAAGLSRERIYQIKDGRR